MIYIFFSIDNICSVLSNFSSMLYNICSMVGNFCSQILNIVKSHICLSEILPLSDIASVRQCLSQIFPLSDSTSVKYFFCQTLPLSDIASIKRYFFQTFLQSDVDLARHTICHTLLLSNIALLLWNILIRNYQAVKMKLNCLIFLFLPSYPCTTHTLYFVINPVSVSPAPKFWRDTYHVFAAGVTDFV